MCLTTDVCLTGDAGVDHKFDPGLVPYFVEIDHELIPLVILLPSAESFKKVCYQYKRKYVHEGVDWDIKQQNEQKQEINTTRYFLFNFVYYCTKF